MSDLVRQESNEISLLSNKAVSDILVSVSNMEVIKKDDFNFLQENKEHLSKVLEKTYIWRTDAQKRSIISDGYCPTLHSKFHQAITEQKVQFDQALYLAKDFEIHRLSLEEKILDLDDIKESTNPRDIIKSKKLQIEIQFMEYELQNMKTAMTYRMKEVRGWQDIQEELLKEMRSQNIPEEDIWDKDSGYMVSMFLQTLTNLQGIKSSTDGAERNNLIQLAIFAYRRIKESGRLDELIKSCNKIQLESLRVIEGVC